jgi:GTPase SAR1 family protein
MLDEPSSQTLPKSSTPVKSVNERRLKIFIMGAKGAGKTCFLAGLSVLSEPNRASSIQVAHDDSETADFLDDLRSTLRQGQWPPPTSTTTVLEMSLVFQRTIVELRVVDYPGEDFTGALRRLDYNKISELHQYSRSADIFLLLFDPHQDLVLNGSKEMEDQLIERQRSHLQAIGQIWKESSGSDAGKLPQIELGLLITKCDTVKGLDTPHEAERYFLAHAPNLLLKLKDYAASVKCLAISAIGRHESTDQPGRCAFGPPSTVAPQGYEQLFDWVVGHKKRKRIRLLKRFLTPSLIALVAFVTGPMVYRETNSARTMTILGSSELSDIEKCENLDGMPWVNNQSKVRRDEFLSRLLQNRKEQALEITTLSDFEKHETELKRISSCRLGSFENEFEQLLSSLLQRKRAVNFQKILYDYKTQPRPVDFRDTCLRFIDEYRQGDDVKELQKILLDMDDETMGIARNRIKSMPSGSSTEIRSKTKAIREFLENYKKKISEDEEKSMRKAVDLALLTAETGQWTLEIQSSGGLTTPYWQSVVVSKHPNSSEQLAIFDGSNGAASKEKKWDRTQRSFSWRVGEPLCVILKIEGRFQDVRVGYAVDNGPMAIQIFSGRIPMNKFPGTESYSRLPYAVFSVKSPNGDPITPEDWSALKSYIWPGNGW